MDRFADLNQIVHAKIRGTPLEGSAYVAYALALFQVNIVAKRESQGDYPAFERRAHQLRRQRPLLMAGLGAALFDSYIREYRHISATAATPDDIIEMSNRFFETMVDTYITDENQKAAMLELLLLVADQLR